jgi:DNA repair exonuclease SbcCD ATPase subunit
MRIKRIRITRFGKLKDTDFELKDGINIIYGGNEAGKSTMINFLAVALYGSLAAAKSGRETIRKRSLPFDGGHAAGVLEVEHDGKVCVVEKRLGTTRKEDSTRSYSKEDFCQLPWGQEPGKDIMGIGGGTFLKTLFVPQSGASFSEERDEGLVQRLANLLDTGDEDVSYNKAVEALEEELKGIRNQRRTGSLDSIYQKRTRLTEQLSESLRSRNEAQALEDRLKLLIDERETLRKESSELHAVKERQRLGSIREEYFRLKSMKSELESLKESSFELGSVPDDESLKALEESEIEISRQRDEHEGILLSSVEAERDLAALSMEMDSYSWFRSSGDDSLREMVSLDREIARLSERLRSLSPESREMKAISGRRVELKRLLSDYERELTILKPGTRSWIFMLPLVLLLAGSYMLYRSNYPFAAAFAALGILSYAAGRRISASRRRKALSRSDILEDEIIALSKELGLDPVEVLKAKKAIDMMPDEEEARELEKRLLSFAERRDSVLAVSLSRDMDDFLKRYDQARTLSAFEKEIIARRDSLKMEAAIALESLESSSKVLIDGLTRYGFSGSPADTGVYLEYLRSQSVKKRNLAMRQESLDLSIRTLIGDKDETEVLKELELIDSLGLEPGITSEELDRRLRDNSTREVNLTEAIGEASRSLSDATAGALNLLEAEDELLSLDIEAESIEKREKSLKLALDVIKESYREFRQGYSPELDRRVSRVFSEMTGTDRTIGVSEFFSMEYLEDGFRKEGAYLSKGAYEQLYLALRLATCDMMFGDGVVPVIMDEPFVHYHKERLENTLDYLSERTENRQYIIFTCHEREIDYLKDKANVIRI